ncbi:Hpt domain-containing protein, partial [Thermodesulfobacteriota bacterium]
LGGNRPLLKKLLLEFAQTYAESGGKVREALSKDNMDGARDLVHAVNGVAGNLSAHALHDAAKGLEKALAQGNRKELESCVPTFERELTDLLQSINRFVEAADDIDREEPNSEAPVLSFESASIRRDMKQLAGLLKASDLCAVKYLASIKEDLAEACATPEVQQLEEAVDAIDFDSALRILERAARKLGFSI